MAEDSEKGVNIWSKPHISKVYEALGAIADNRVDIDLDLRTAKVYSSSRGKFYTVSWNEDFSQIMSNDNSAFYVGQLSYPMIAVLLLSGKIEYDPEVSEILKDVKWKDINQKYKNDFDKTIKYVLNDLAKQGKEIEEIKKETTRILNFLNGLEIEYFGKKVLPPSGY